MAVGERIFQQVKGIGKKDLRIAPNLPYGEIIFEIVDREFHESIMCNLTLEQATHLRDALNGYFRETRG